MRCRLVFQDWQRRGESIYATPEGIQLSEGDFHTGTVFTADVHFDDPVAEGDVRRADARFRAHPVFLVLLETPKEAKA